MKLSIIIVNYNVKYYLEQCLLSVLKAVRPIEAQIFVVDNNSSDGSMEYLIPRFPQVHFIINKDNPGFAIANNQAIRQSKGEYVLLLNPDTVVGECVLKNTCDFMDSHPEAGGLGVKMIDGTGNFLPESKRGFPSPWNSFCKMFGLSRIFPYSRIFAGYHLRYLDKDEVHSVDVLAGAFMLLRKSILNEIGLLDETFFMYGEDIDLSYRITLAGYKNYYFPQPIIHYKGESTKKNVAYIRVFYQAMIVFYKKHFPNTGKIFRFLIYFAIYLHAGLRILEKYIFPRRMQKCVSGKNKVYYRADKLSFSEIIGEMEINSRNNNLYYIYYPENDLLISGENVIFNPDKKKYDLS